MAGLEAYDFWVGPPKDFTVAQKADLDTLTRRSLHEDFGPSPEDAGSGRPPEQLEYMARFAATIRDDPNEGVGTSQLRAGQRFGRVRGVVAIHSDSQILSAYLTVADNVSGLVPDPKDPPRKQYYNEGYGKGERAYKMRVPTDRARSHRYYWAGLFVAGQDTRDEIADTPPDEGSLIDAMLTIGAEGRREVQPGRSYPYEDEYAWIGGLLRAGYTRLDAPTAPSEPSDTDSAAMEPVHAFGDESDAEVDPVGQMVFGIGSIKKLREVTLPRHGVEAAVHNARHGGRRL
jgi:hypothetical protein